MPRTLSRQALICGLALAVMSPSARLLGQDSEIADLKKRVENLEKTPLVGVERNKPFIQSADKKFRLNFGGRLQIRHTYEAHDVNRGRTDDAATSDESYLELERARLNFSGHVFDPRIQFRIEFDGQSDAGTGSTALAEFVEGWITYKLVEAGEAGHEMSLGAGQFKPFYGRQEKTSSGKQLLVDRSLANEFFNIDRNLGLWIEGRQEIAKEGVFNAFNYEIAVTNGFDSINVRPASGTGEIDHIPALIAHLDFDVLGNLGKDALAATDFKRRETPGLTTGASFAFDSNNASGRVPRTSLQYDVYQIAYDLVYRHAGFSFSAEYFGRFLDLDSDTRGSSYTHGAYVEAGYLISSDFPLEPVVRGSTVWDRGGAGDNGNAVEVGTGFNYFFYGDNLKWTTDVSWLDIPPVMSLSTESLPGATAATGAFSASSSNLSAFQGVLVRTQIQLDF